MGEKIKGSNKVHVEKKNKFMSFMHYVALPIRVIGKAHDFYTKTMFDCAGRVGQGSMVVGPCTVPPQLSSLPRNFSGSSSSKEDGDMEELRELVKVVSLNRNFNGIVTHAEKISGRRVAAAGGGGVGRCYSVGVGKIGRIDEELPCDFEEDVLFPRCRSYVIT